MEACPSFLRRTLGTQANDNKKAWTGSVLCGDIQVFEMLVGRKAGRRVVAMADVSERTLQVSVLVAFASGVVLGWQANRLRRRYLDWRKRRLQDKLATTQKKLDLA